MHFTLWLLDQALALPAARPDWLARAVDVAQVLLVPIGSAILAFIWSTWRKVSALYTVVFGRPEVKEDDGIVGSLRDLTQTVGLIDRDVERLCDKNGIHRTEARG